VKTWREAFGKRHLVAGFGGYTTRTLRESDTVKRLAAKATPFGFTTRERPTLSQGES
jgi:hypothetical protein